MSEIEKLPIIIKNPKLTDIEIFGIDLVTYNNEYNYLVKSNNIKEIINNLRADYLNKKVVIANIPKDDSLSIKSFDSKKTIGSFILDIGFLESVKKIDLNRLIGYVFISLSCTDDKPDFDNYSNIKINTYLENPL
tara:strand:- start:128 stop:532 length:405 start_codon:yes stop_codon:yes gene_type:complete